MSAHSAFNYVRRVLDMNKMSAITASSTARTQPSATSTPLTCCIIQYLGSTLFWGLSLFCQRHRIRSCSSVSTRLSKSEIKSATCDRISGVGLNQMLSDKAAFYELLLLLSPVSPLRRGFVALECTLGCLHHTAVDKALPQAFHRID